MSTASRCPVVLILASIILSWSAVRATADEPAADAVSGVVTGKVQKVGFRAHILRQAIAFNLAGVAENQADGSVHFTLQGSGKRIEEALKAIAAGTDKSADVKVATKPAKPDPALKTFTVVAWTSTTRNITKPYNLVFTLREDGKTVTAKQANSVYHHILADTLEGEDLDKLTEHGD